MEYREQGRRYIDESRLQDLLRTKVQAARVVYIEGQGFWALIPHFHGEEYSFYGFALAEHFLGKTYQDSRIMLYHCWNIPPE